MRFTIFSAFLFISFSTFAQRAIVITSIPENTPEGDQIHFAGEPNGWNPGSPEWVFGQEGAEWILGIPETAPGSFQGKVTRGSWDTVEGNATGGFLPDRTIDFASTDTVYIEVLSWEGGFVADDLPENLVVFDDEFYMTELDRTRRIRVLLPTDYDDTAIDYPVLYMHDGQNLFSVQESFAGEWEIDEAMAAFEEDGYNGAIIVAIDNGAERIAEYTPYPNPQYGGGDGDAYADFIVNTLKPAIDEEYRTLPEREHTGIMGSSLGGLISFYAGMKYQDVFSKVGVFSPSFWFSDSIYDFADEVGKTAEMRFYFLAGGQESATLEARVQQMVDLLEEEGFEDQEINYLTVANGQHSEWFWAQEFPDAFEWLYLTNPLSSGSLFRDKFELYPNPTDSFIRLSGVGENLAFTIRNSAGQKLLSGSTGGGRIDVSRLPAGIYFVNALGGAQFISEPFIKL